MPQSRSFGWPLSMLRRNVSDLAALHGQCMLRRLPGGCTYCMQEEERLWTELIDKYEGVDAPWRSDIVGRAYGNRGNARTRQGKMDAALVDYNKAIDTCPWSVDPVLNRHAWGSAIRLLHAGFAGMQGAPACPPCVLGILSIRSH